MNEPAAAPPRLFWIPVVALAAALLLLVSGWGERLSRPASDWQHRLLAPQSPPSGVLVIDIDDASLNELRAELGSWPLRRDVYALLIDWLRDNGARAIALDLLFADSMPGDTALARAIARPGAPVLLAVAGLRAPAAAGVPPTPAVTATAAPATDWPSLVFPAPSLWPSADAPPRLGVITTPLDDDGRLRSLPLWHRAAGAQPAALWPTMPLAVWQALAPADAAAPWPVHDDGRVHLALPENARMATTLPLARAMRAALGQERLDTNTVRGQVVFIGSSALLADSVMTVSGQSSGTAVLAQAYAAMRDNTVLPRPHHAIDAALLALALLPAVLTARRGRIDGRRDLLNATLALLLMAGLALLLLLALRQVSVWAPPLAAWAVGLAGVTWARQRTLVLAQRRMAYERAVAAEANRAKSEFLANVSHEIRTPLNALLGIAELLADSPLSARQQEHVRVFRESGRALQELINDLLDISKIEAGRFELHPAPFSLQGLLTHLRELLQGRADAKGLTLQFDVDAGVPDGVLGDRQRLEQALINLLGNAIKFTPQGRVTLRVTPGAAAPELAFSVIDTGIGIAPSQLESIFEPFAQADGSVTRQFGGTGLGLSITRRMARLMGGSVAVQSRPGLGSEFTLRLPLPAAVLPLPAASDAAADAPQLPTRPLRVLLAEDNEVNVYVFRGMLERDGITIDVAPHGAAALALAQRQRYDIAFIDLQMPGMDGLTLARELRRFEAQSAAPRMPLVALTANAFAADMQRSRDAGCDLHLTKPTSRAELLQAMARLLPGPAVAQATEPALPLTPASAPTPGCVIDRATALQRMGGNEALYRRVADHAAVFMLHWSDDFRAAQRDGPAERVLRLAHDLKSVARSVGAMALGDAAAALEASLRTSPDRVPDAQALADVQQALPAAVNALTPVSRSP